MAWSYYIRSYNTVLADVVWGDVDVMFVDMPPGTGDVPPYGYAVTSGRWRNNGNITAGSC